MAYDEYITNIYRGQASNITPDEAFLLCHLTRGVNLPYRDVEEMDAWKAKITQDITELKSSQWQIKATQEGMQTDIHQLQISEKLQDSEIANLKETLGEIKDEKNCIRRCITGAVITVSITADIGGLIGIAIAFIYG